jgi:hypothetical protein
MVKLELISHSNFVVTENPLKGVGVLDHAIGRLLRV